MDIENACVHVCIHTEMLIYSFIYINRSELVAVKTGQDKQQLVSVFVSATLPVFLCSEDTCRHTKK